VQALLDRVEQIARLAQRPPPHREFGLRRHSFSTFTISEWSP
jgi:hypothetical protein